MAKGEAKGKGKDKGKGKGASEVVCWACNKTGHRSFECPLNKRVASVEEGGTVADQVPIDIDAGGVFWLSAVAQGAVAPATPEKKSYLDIVKSSQGRATKDTSAIVTWKSDEEKYLQGYLEH